MPKTPHPGLRLAGFTPGERAKGLVARRANAAKRDNMSPSAYMLGVVLANLGAAPITRERLRAHVPDRHPSAVSQWLGHLIKRGYVKRLGHGVYVLGEKRADAAMLAPKYRRLAQMLTEHLRAETPVQPNAAVNENAPAPPVHTRTGELSPLLQVLKPFARYAQNRIEASAPDNGVPLLMRHDGISNGTLRAALDAYVALGGSFAKAPAPAAGQREAPNDADPDLLQYLQS